MLAVAPASVAIAAPETAVSSGVLAGVACPRAGHYWAVGSQRAAGVTRTLAERWNGTRWSIVPTP